MTTDPAATRPPDQNRLRTSSAALVGLALLFVSNLRLPSVGSPVMLLGMRTVVSAAWFAVSWMLRYVAKDSLSTFGNLRIPLGAILMVLVAADRL